MSTATAVKTRPILFSGPMIRALLSGQKSQTRRVAKNFPDWVDHVTPWSDGGVQIWNAADDGMSFRECPYGKPGDQLWVRETWRLDFDSGHGAKQADGRYKTDNHYRVVYRAGGEVAFEWVGYDFEPDPYIKALGRDDSWRPSIFMPKWASRILLEIVEVRVERLRSISVSDQLAEGATPEKPFGTVWRAINTKPGIRWEDNPWVWAISFRRLEPTP